ncbi:MAG TPA: ribosome maturation factor RimM [Gemmatimonadales bacterium]|nr:ribosome maturation factor RimM [Gemmatimonadales bacterium]
MDTPPLLVVGRLRRPHGLKGEMTLFPLTDAPERVLAQGKQLQRMDLRGEVVGGPVTIERSRAYHREWLLKFAGEYSREELAGWGGQFLAAPASELDPPAEGEVYLAELAGFAVRRENDEALGIVSDVYELPGGITIEVQGPKREFLLPYRQEFIRRVDRAARVLIVAPPDGLIED